MVGPLLGIGGCRSVATATVTAAGLGAVGGSRRGRNDSTVFFANLLVGSGK